MTIDKKEPPSRWFSYGLIKASTYGMWYTRSRVAKTQINEKVMEIIFLKIMDLTIKLLPINKTVLLEQ